MMHATAYLYFLQVEPDGPIRIGCSYHPKTRLTQARNNCPWPVKMLGLVEATMPDEGAIHRLLRPHVTRKDSRSWYHPHPAVLLVVSTILSPDFCWDTTSFIRLRRGARLVALTEEDADRLAAVLKNPPTSLCDMISAAAS